MNRLTVIGRVVREIEVKNISDGNVVLNNAIAVPRTFKVEGKPDTDFINFVVWGKRAVLLGEYCEKGDLVGLDGRIQSRTYVDENQEKKYVVEMVVDNIHFLQPRKDQTKSSQGKSKIKTANGTKELQPLDIEKFKLK